MQLATAAELQDHLGLSSIDTNRADQILTQVSEETQGVCSRVALEETTDDVLKLRGTYQRELELPRGPVTSVSEVQIDGDVVDTDQYDLVVEGVRGWLIRGVLSETFTGLGAGYWGGPDEQVQVTYTHGYSTLPDDIHRIVLSTAARIYTNPDGAVRKGIGDYSASFVSGSHGSVSGLTEADVRYLRRRYGRPAEAVRI